MEFEAAITKYMQDKFLHSIHRCPGLVAFPSTWPLDLLMECDRAVGVLVAAFQNQSKFSVLTAKSSLSQISPYVLGYRPVLR